MTTCKTGAEHIKSLKDGRTVYIDGKLVPDVTLHPAFEKSIKSTAMLYDFQAKPENIELMTFKPEGSSRRVNRAWQMPRNYTEMVQRRKALQAWAAQTLVPIPTQYLLIAGPPTRSVFGRSEISPDP